MNNKILIFTGMAVGIAIGTAIYHTVSKKFKENNMNGKHEIRSDEFYICNNLKVNVLYFDYDEEFVVFHGSSARPTKYELLGIEEAIELLGEEVYDHCLACSENRTKQMPKMIFSRNYDTNVDCRIIMSTGSYKKWKETVDNVVND